MAERFRERDAGDVVQRVVREVERQQSASRYLFFLTMKETNEWEKCSDLLLCHTRKGGHTRALSEARVLKGCSPRSDGKKVSLKETGQTRAVRKVQFEREMRKAQRDYTQLQHRFAFRSLFVPMKGRFKRRSRLFGQSNR